MANYLGNNQNDVDLGVCTDWTEGETHGRIVSRQNQKYPTSPKKDVLITSPVSIELRVNSNNSSSEEADKLFFTAGSIDGRPEAKKIVGILDAYGNLSITGKVFEGQTNLGYK